MRYTPSISSVSWLDAEVSPRRGEMNAQLTEHETGDVRPLRESTGGILETC